MSICCAENHPHTHVVADIEAPSTDHTRVTSDVVKLAIATLECVKIASGTRILPQLNGTLKRVNALFSAASIFPRLENIVTGRALFDNPISIDHQETINPFTAASTACLLVGDVAACTSLSHSIGLVSCSTLEGLVGEIENIALVRTTVSMVASILEAVDATRLMLLNREIDRDQMCRLAICVCKIAYGILIEAEMAWVRFIAFVASGTASLISLVYFYSTDRSLNVSALGMSSCSCC